MKNPTFREIVQTRISSVSSHAMVKKRDVARRISVRNHNRLLWNFDGAIGGKTGYTLAAQKCFVGAVARNGVTLIVSILGSRDQWGDTKKLLGYGFDNYPTLKAGTQQPSSQEIASEHVSIGPEGISALIITPQEGDGPKSTEGYVVQIGSFRDRSRAESLLKQFRESGFDAFAEKVSLGRGETVYRVRIGPYSELLQAQETAQKVFLKSGQRVLILPAQAANTSDGEPSSF